MLTRVRGRRVTDESDNFCPLYFDLTPLFNRGTKQAFYSFSCMVGKHCPSYFLLFCVTFVVFFSALIFLPCQILEVLTLFYPLNIEILLHNRMNLNIVTKGPEGVDLPEPNRSSSERTGGLVKSCVRSIAK